MIDDATTIATATAVEDYTRYRDDYLRDAKAGLVTYRGKPKKASTL